MNKAITALLCFSMMFVMVVNVTGQGEMYWKPEYSDYAPSGVPDFDQRQIGTYPWIDQWGAWSHCGPVAVADSLWWLDSEFEPHPVAPPVTNDGFPLVQAYGAWDDHASQNLPWLVEHLAFLMDTDGRRTGLVHSGTNVNDMEAGLTHYLSWSGVNPPGDANGDGVVNQLDVALVQAALGSVPGMPNWKLAADIWPASMMYPPHADNIIDPQDLNLVMANLGRTGLFYEHTVMTPDFALIEEEVKKCQDVVLLVGYWIWTGSSWYREPGGHYVTVAGVDSTNIKLALSDPVQDAFESGLIPEGRIPVPHVHPPPEPPYITHNDAQYVSQDIYSVAQITPPWPPCLGGNWMLVNFASWRPAPPYFAVIESAVITSPYPDVAITDVTTSKTGCSPREVVGQGNICHIKVTVQNQGGLAKDFNVTIYANATRIDSQNISLACSASTILTFTWNTTGFSYNNYTISAVADTLIGEIDTLDNTYTDGTLHVGIPGDVNADGKVDVKDVYAVGRAYGTSQEGPNPPGRSYSPNCDINCDYKVDVKDYYVACKNYGLNEP